MADGNKERWVSTKRITKEGSAESEWEVGHQNRWRTRPPEGTGVTCFCDECERVDDQVEAKMTVSDSYQDFVYP